MTGVSTPNCVSVDYKVFLMKVLIHDAWNAATHNQRIYPQMYQATEALGFTLWAENPLAVPQKATAYNPYKELVK
jgi:hypothetical protein